MLASDVQGSVPESNVKWQKIFKPTKGRHLFSRVAVILLISVELLFRQFPCKIICVLVIIY